MRARPRRSSRRHSVQARAFAAGEDDERLAGEVAPRQRFSRGPRMTGWDRGAERLVAKQHRLQAERGVREDGAGEADVEPAFGHHFPDSLGRAFFEMHSDLRAAPRVFPDRAAEESLRRRADVSQAQLALLPRGGAAHAADRAFELLEKERGFGKQRASRRGERDAAPGARDDFHPEFGFQFFQGPAESGLRHIQPPSGARKTQFLGNGLEVAEVAKIHLVFPNRSRARGNLSFQKVRDLGAEARPDFGKEDLRPCLRGVQNVRATTAAILLSWKQAKPFSSSIPRQIFSNGRSISCKQARRSEYLALSVFREARP